jgi:hypothetical protein
MIHNALCLQDVIHSAITNGSTKGVKLVLCLWCAAIITSTSSALLSCLQDAINFAITSGSAKGVKLVLFTEDDLAMGKATYEVMLDPATNKTGGQTPAPLSVLFMDGKPL